MHIARLGASSVRQKTVTAEPTSTQLEGRFCSSGFHVCRSMCSSQPAITGLSRTTIPVACYHMLIVWTLNTKFTLFGHLESTKTRQAEPNNRAIRSSSRSAFGVQGDHTLQLARGVGDALQLVLVTPPVNWWLRLGYRIAYQIERITHELSPCDAKEPHIGAVDFWHQPGCWAARISRIGCWQR